MLTRNRPKTVPQSFPRNIHLAGKTQRAGGDQLVYTAATQESVLTAEPPNRPWLRSDGRLQCCDIIRGNMETGDLRGIGSVQVVPDQKQ
jgi:hypothetical protein